MNGNAGTMRERDFVENVAAELTEAAYPVMLRHGVPDNWLDLELDLWRTLKETVTKWDRE